MDLPMLPFKIPEVHIPFEIPVLMHPVVDHFAIALPVIVLLLEIINLFTKKRAIGVVSFFLLLLTVAVLAVVYLTGLVDGKEAFNFLSEAGQSDLTAHKLLGIYLMLASSVVLVFKLFSAMISRGMMKGLYLFILVLFVVGMLKQGKDGGELVYQHGANVERVKTLDDEMFDIKEELEELEELNKKIKATVNEATEVVEKKVVEIKKDENINEKNISNQVALIEEAVAEEVNSKEANQSVKALVPEIKEDTEVISEVKPESTVIETTSDTNAS